MSTNYNILLRSEKKLRKLVAEYVQLMLDIHSKLWNDIETLEGEEIHTILDNVERRLKKAIIAEDELLDECIWTISKDDPRANHLKFIISIIISSKDLTRASEYAHSIAKIVVRKNFEKSQIKLIKPVQKLYLQYIYDILKTYESNKEDKLEKVDDLYIEFEEQLGNQEKIIRDELKKQNNEIGYIQISQITRLMNSTIERLKGIFPSTLFTKSHTSIISTKISK